eukprot:tig00021127_g18683.t1
MNARSAEVIPRAAPSHSAREVHEKYMRLAIEVGQRNPKAPFGAVVVRRSTGEVLVEGVNNSRADPTLHGEVAAIRACAAKYPGVDWSDLALYTTAEPCPMCMAAIMWAGIRLVVFGTSIPYLRLVGWDQIDIAADAVAAQARGGLPQAAVVGGVLQRECNALFAEGRRAFSALFDDTAGPAPPAAARGLLPDYGATRFLSLPPAMRRLYDGDWRVPADPATGPYVYVNFAAAHDGRISFVNPPGGHHITNSSVHDRWLMAALRARADAIVIGDGTLRAHPEHMLVPEHIFPDDDGEFKALRAEEGRRPVPLHVFMSAEGDIPRDASVLRRDDVHVVVATTRRGAERLRSSRFYDTRSGPMEVLELGEESADWRQLARILHADYGAATVLCEGGPQVYGSLLRSGIPAEEFLTRCPVVVGAHAAAGSPRPSLVEGAAFQFGATPSVVPLAARRAGSYLFFRSAILPPALAHVALGSSGGLPPGERSAGAQEQQSSSALRHIQAQNAEALMPRLEAPAGAGRGGPRPPRGRRLPPRPLLLRRPPSGRRPPRPAAPPACMHRSEASGPLLSQVNPGTDGRPYGSEYVTLRQCERTPRSDHDFFVLNYVRAFADGIVTSGKNLREEPRLRYALAGPAAEGLLDWRVRTLGKTGPQLVLVLTRGQDPAGLLSHAMFTAASDRPIVPVLFCPAAAAPRLEAAAAERELRHVRVVGAERPSIAAAVAYLRAAGCGAVSVEAGPSTSRELHAARAVDTLLLSVYHAPAIAPDVVDPALAFVPRAAIDDAFALASAHRVASRAVPSRPAASAPAPLIAPGAPPAGETWEIRRYEAKR